MQAYPCPVALEATDDIDVLYNAANDRGGSDGSLVDSA
jgi:hypothetical protein